MLDSNLHTPLAPNSNAALPGEPGVASSDAPSNESPTLAYHNLSTPSPHQPERATRAETDFMAAYALPPTAPLPPIPGYILDRRAGRGGMGVVYRALHSATGRLVALKLINPAVAADDVARERFVREVHTLASIKHPNIVPVFDAGDWHGLPFCTMEYVEGGTLSEHLDRVRADLPAAVRLLAKVARAVDALHSAGIIHRDLKPLNILLGPGDQPMVADFGLAKWLGEDGDITHSGMPLGTRSYMSPEQTLGGKQNYTPACDVWALGVTLYELLTGQRPFADDGVTDVYHVIRHAVPQPMAALSPDVPAPLQAVVSKCLAKKPEDRYPTAAALADHLEAWLRGEPLDVEPPSPVPPEPPTPVERPRRWRVVMGAVGAVGVIALALWAGAFGVGNGEPSAAPNPEPQKTIGERVAAGEEVPLTDDTGRPLVPWVSEPGHEVAPARFGGYHAFTCGPPGILSFSAEPLGFAHRVSARVAVRFDTDAKAGIYAGRKVWPGSQPKLESFVLAAISPRSGEVAAGAQRAQWLLPGSLSSIHWEADGPFHSNRLVGELPLLWAQPGEKENSVRFTEIVIDVYPEAVDAKIDNLPFKALPSGDFFQGLNVLLNQFAVNKAPRSGQAFGSGIGLYCKRGTCVVRNLTVSRLPNKN